MNILFLARMTMSFNGDTVYKKPLGGSESALLYISRELAARGHKITIINNCGEEEGIYAGVEYKRFTTLNDVTLYSRSNPIDIFVAFRDLPALLFPIKAKKRIWWGQDDFSNLWNNPFPIRTLGIGVLKLAGLLSKKLTDKFIVVSHWMADICEKYLGIPGEMLYITSNGVHLPYFEPEVQREKYRLAYTSVPWRGLDILLNIFPKIKKAIPGTELYVYCGLDLGVVQKRDKKRAKQILENSSMPGVHIMGTKSHSELALELKKSSILTYPSHACRQAGFWGETSGVSVLESLAAGTPPITSNRGALPEAVHHGENGIIIDGDPYCEEYQDKFLEATISLLKDTHCRENMSKNAIEYSHNRYSYKILAQEWETEFLSMLKKK